MDVFRAPLQPARCRARRRCERWRLIEEVEKTRRGLYGGVVGYLDFAGNADFAIAIRTALMRNGTAYVQAGGGVVADSNGSYEYNEARNKARAVLNAIVAAETLAAPGANRSGC